MRVLLAIAFLFSACAPAVVANTKTTSIDKLRVLASSAVVSAPPDNDAVMLEIKEFDAPTFMGLSKKLDELDKKNLDKIYLKLYSYGGSIHWGMEIIQRLEAMETPITCVVDWKAYSMGAFLLESDACDKRLMTKRSTLLFHNPLVDGVGGNAHELKNIASRLEAMGAALMAGTAERLKISEDELMAKVDDKDWTLAYREALKVGAIDDLIKVSDMPKVTEFPKPTFLQMLLGE